MKRIDLHDQKLSPDQVTLKFLAYWCAQSRLKNFHTKPARADLNELTHEKKAPVELQNQYFHEKISHKSCHVTTVF